MPGNTPTFLRKHECVLCWIEIASFSYALDHAINYVSFNYANGTRKHCIRVSYFSSLVSAQFNPSISGPTGPAKGSFAIYKVAISF